MNKLVYVKKTFKWEELLNSVKTGAVDIAIGGITATKQREAIFKPLKFSNRYKNNHQIFIKARETELHNFPEDLINATVAVQVNTTNMKAANQVLSQKFGFQIAEVATFQAAYTKLFSNNNVDFALIDYEYYKIHKKNYDIVQFSPYLDKDLKSFYNNLNDSDSEYFAIAVHEPTPIKPAEESLLIHLNEILKKDTITEFITSSLGDM